MIDNRNGVSMLQPLKDVRKTLGYTQMEFSKLLGITQTSYSMIESGARPLSKKYVKIICMTFHVSETFLIEGTGDMFVSSPYENELLELFNRLQPDTQEYLLTMAKELYKMQEKIKIPQQNNSASQIFP